MSTLVFSPSQHQASTLYLPPGSWVTVLDCLCAHFPAIGREQWLDRIARGRVLDVNGNPISLGLGYKEGLCIYYFREVLNEKVIPVQENILYADEHLEADGSKLYRLHGTLFFASTTPFLNQFDPANDPAQVTLDCRHLSFVDYSAIAALMTLRERYTKAGKHLRVLHLSERCKKLLKRAKVHHD